MTIVENNALLDGFMESKGIIIPVYDQNSNIIDQDYKPHSYHSDWNLLMDCIVKIEDLKYTVEIIGQTTHIDHGDSHFRTITSVSENSKRESVYNAVVSFVKYIK